MALHLGSFISLSEQEWLVAEISSWLEEYRRSLPPRI